MIDATTGARTVPGAGVRNVLRPGKRLRNWHRAQISVRSYAAPFRLSLRQYARALAEIGGSMGGVAQAWLECKGVRL